MQKVSINNSLNEIEKILIHGHNLVPITDQLIEKLTNEKGIPKDDLINLQKQGAQYSISRDSFFFPTETRQFY